MAEKTRAEELHDEYRKKVWEDAKSGTENFDKYLLTFSSGAGRSACRWRLSKMSPQSGGLMEYKSGIGSPLFELLFGKSVIRPNERVKCLTDRGA